MQLHGLPAVVVMVILNQKYYISKLIKEKGSFYTIANSGSAIQRWDERRYVDV